MRSSAAFPALPPAASAPASSRWSLALDRPARPTPFLAWLIALAAAVFVGVSIASPKTAVGVFAAGIALYAAGRIVASPVNGFLVMLAIFPFYTLVRGVATVYQIPLPFALLGLWTEVVLCLMFASLLIGAAVGKRPALRFCWADAPLILLVLSCVYGVVLTIAQKDITALVYGIHTSLAPFLFYFAARWLRPSEADLKRILQMWLGACAVFAVLSLADYLVRPTFIIRIAAAMRPEFGKPFDPYDFYRWYPRMQSLMFAEQLWGTVCAAISLFCLAYAGTVPFTRKTGRWWWPLFSLITLCLLLTMSRGAIVGWVVGIVVLALFRGRHRKYIAVLATLGVLLASAVIIIFNADTRVRALTMRVAALGDTSNQNAYDRTSQWQVALKDFPLAPSGHGLGRRGMAALVHGDGGDAIVDGGIFKILAEQGALGVLMTLVGLFWTLAVLYRRLRETRGLQQAMCFAALAYLSGLIVQNTAGNMFDAYFIAHIAWILTGFAITPLWPDASPRGRSNQGVNTLPVSGAL